ncbi:MAG: hydantoinase B/oxoprolinase family protein [Acidimicrobiales bacterium]
MSTRADAPADQLPDALGIAVDVGGTFTDLVINDGSSVVLVVKVPSVPSDPSTGVTNAVAEAARRLDVSPRHLIERCERFVHGSTVATNAVLEHKLAPVGLLTTRGFRDALEIRRGRRVDQWDHRAPWPEVLVPRSLRFGITGRLAHDGTEIEPLDLDDIAAAVDVLRGKVEAVAVCFHHSYVSDRHERAAGELLGEAWPGRVSLSSDLAPVLGEYERASTAVVNAGLLPIVSPYLRRLEDALRAWGLRTPLLLLQSNGGTVPLAAVERRPVDLVLSGPAAVVGALRSLDDGAIDDGGRTEPDDVISMEIGGTSCDVAVQISGAVGVVDELSVGGSDLRIPAVDVQTIGAGGGTIAWLDDAGMLQMGPQGAGAVPGPASYQRGGTQPTATDAQLVLGRLHPGPYAGGAVDLSLEAATRAIDEHIATPLRITVEAAAAGMLTLLEQHVQAAVETITIERGRDPGSLTLVAAGGAGAVHGAAVARALGIPRWLVPSTAGVFCAAGMLRSELRRDVIRSVVAPLETIGADGLLASLDERDGEAWRLVESDWPEPVANEARSTRWALDMRYPGQLWSVRVELGAADEARQLLASPHALGQLRQRFEAYYQRLFGHIQPDGRLDVTSVSVVASSVSPGALPNEGASTSVQPTPLRHQDCWLTKAQGRREVPVYGPLEVGQELDGPFLIELPTTTVLGLPGDHLEVTAGGDLAIEIRHAGDTVTHDVETDPIALALVQARLDHLSRHMGWVMTRTARSPIFSQSHDFSCFVTDADGTLISTADGIPIHTGGGGFAVRAILEQFAGDIGHDDVFLLNDPYTSGGNHLPDWVIGRPVFVDDSLVGFCCNRAHQSDIGGGAAGTYNPEATEIWHEGLRIPVMKLVERGKVRSDLWRLLQLNSRTPDLLDGDLRAMLGSTEIGAERMVELVNDLGTEAARRAFAELCDYADRRFRAAIAALPDGTWRASEHWDDDCFGPADVDIELALTIAGDQVTVDFTGTDDQIRGFKNSSYVNTWSAVSMGLISFFEPDLPRNEGTFRNVDLIAPLGSVVNARPPAPLTMNTVIPAHEIVHLIWRCLSQADPTRALAGWGKNIFCVTAATPGASEPFVMYHWSAAAGGGATDERDGFNQIGHLIALGGLTLPETEFVEQQYPVRVVEQTFRCDGGGAGTFRGGTGIDYVVDVLAPARWSFRGEGLGEPTGYGIAGGLAGAGGVMAIDGADLVVPKYGLATLGPVRLRASSPGGGGYGDPLLRDRRLVARDVADGVVSPEAAASIYGYAEDDA